MNPYTLPSPRKAFNDLGPPGHAVAGILFCCMCVVAMSLAGCGAGGDRPQLGRVSGTVTLDGKPLPDATVTFRHPQKRASHGTTDENGCYDLIYIRDEKGAAVGTHKVEIDTGTEETPEMVPAKYNVRTTLTAEVKAGKNNVDFDLTGN